MKLEHCAEPSRGQKRKRDHSEEMFALAALIFPRTSLNPFMVLKMEKAPSVKTMKLEPKDDEQLKEELDSTVQPNKITWFSELIPQLEEQLEAEKILGSHVRLRLLKTEKELQAAQVLNWTNRLVTQVPDRFLKKKP